MELTDHTNSKTYFRSCRYRL